MPPVSPWFASQPITAVLHRKSRDSLSARRPASVSGSRSAGIGMLASVLQGETEAPQGERTEVPKCRAAAGAWCIVGISWQATRPGCTKSSR